MVWGGSRGACGWCLAVVRGVLLVVAVRAAVALLVLLAVGVALGCVRCGALVAGWWC